MECVANYEIKSELSIEADHLILRIRHPSDHYRVRIKNIPRSDYTTPFLLSMHLYFHAPSMDEGRAIADDLLADFLNMLAFTTGSSFRRHRIRQLIDVTPGATEATTVFHWGDSIGYEDPQSVLDDELTKSIEKLLEFDIPPAIRRAMRWFRLGINSEIPDDQFMNFWFALEIVAEFQKSTERVPDRCPRCQSPLHCKICDTEPMHRPYSKQAIRALLQSVDKDCDDETIERLEKTRNALMHGLTLWELEDQLMLKHDHLVDTLGHLLWKSLIHQFPPEMFDGKLAIMYPTTYLRRTLQAFARLETVVPVGRDGDRNLDFYGVTMSMVPFGPPQSAKPTVIRMSPEQHSRLDSLAWTKSEDQEMLKRVWDQSKLKDGFVYALVLSTDMVVIKNALSRGERGDWQDLFREIMEEATDRD